MFAKLLKFIKNAQILPRISDTERAALEAGTVWVEGEFFSGNPDFSSMLGQAYPKLSKKEQDFLDGPVEELCRTVNMWDLMQTRVTPEEVNQYLAEKGFLGLIIPEEYGGLGMSTLGRSSVMMKTSGLGPVGTKIVIPNTLGAAELLIAYGTQEQKDHYLPRLATGEYIPCFGLTEPTAGSDAAAMKATADVFKDDDGELKLKMNFSKRYITQAPVANLISIAATLRDPDDLLGKGKEPGITVVIVHQGTPGLRNGDHHLPISAFDNGPIYGEDVVVPVGNIMGGVDMAGQGWRMLMEQLAGGRAVSLPAGGVASCKLAAAAAGPYSMVRQQFNFPIGMMEGPEKKLAHIAAMTYAQEAARIYTCAAVDNGEHPPVASAILKQHSTEMGQKLVIDGMDVMAGAGVMQGPNNVLGGAYIGAPVGVTVEGANILTRTLIIFGQGAVRCHPYAVDTLNAVESDDTTAFRTALLGWMKHSVMNGLRTVVRGITRGWSYRSPVSGPTAGYYRKLAWASARFAFMTDLALFLVGGKLKQRGKLSGRFADVLSWQLYAFSTLRRYEAEGRLREDLPVVKWAVEHALQQIQEGFEGIYANFNVPVIGWLLKYPGRAWLRINPLSTGPSDSLDRPVAAAIQTPGAQFDRIIAGLAKPADENLGLGRLWKAWHLVTEAQGPMTRLSKAAHKGQISGASNEEKLADAVDKGVVTAAEADLIKRAEAARFEAIQVDVFTKEEYQRMELASGEADEPARKVANG